MILVNVLLHLVNDAPICGQCNVMPGSFYVSNEGYFCWQCAKLAEHTRVETVNWPGRLECVSCNRMATIFQTNYRIYLCDICANN